MNPLGRAAVLVLCSVLLAACGDQTSSGNAAFATSTSAVNAAGSLTAISARFLRSTSTPAALRP